MAARVYVVTEKQHGVVGQRFIGIASRPWEADWITFKAVAQRYGVSYILRWRRNWDEEFRVLSVTVR